MYSRLAGVAQLVEQLIRNQQVISSSLIAGSRNAKKNNRRTPLLHRTSLRHRRVSDRDDFIEGPATAALSTQAPPLRERDCPDTTQRFVRVAA
jgi:hypothetical protein